MTATIDSLEHLLTETAENGFTPEIEQAFMDGLPGVFARLRALETPDTPATGDLLQRLQTMDSYGHKPYPTHFVNPDGPEAARVIAELVDRNAALVDLILRAQLNVPECYKNWHHAARAALTLKETEDGQG